MDATEGAVAEPAEEAEEAEEAEAKAPGETGDLEATGGDAPRPEDDAQRPGDDAQRPGDDAPRPGDQLTDDEILQAVAALVFASPDPLSERKLAALLEGPSPARVRGAIAALKERLESSGLPLELRGIAGGFQILTAPRMGEVVKRLFADRKAERISPAALETLSVVAYRQPVTKAEIEAIRGVQVGPILRALVDRGLVRAVGRADVPGHPLQYGTTREFLDRFGLSGTDDLPRDSELAR